MSSAATKIIGYRSAARELQGLRREQHTIQPQRLTPASENPFHGFADDCLEIELDFAVEKQAVFE
jgi:hypothetical protein